jgi:hypothetical protein
MREEETNKLILIYFGKEDLHVLLKLYAVIEDIFHYLDLDLTEFIVIYLAVNKVLKLLQMARILVYHKVKEVKVKDLKEQLMFKKINQLKTVKRV